MKRLWRISLVASSAVTQSELLFLKPRRCVSRSWISNRFSFELNYTTESTVVPPSLSTPCPWLSLESNNANLRDIFMDSNRARDRRLQLFVTTDSIKEELVHAGDDVLRVLEEKLQPLMSKYPDGSAFVNFIERLLCSPQLAIEVLNWRRQIAKLGFPMVNEEYSKSIAVAGKLNKIELAVELFNEASRKKLKKTSTYNALLGAYMYNGYPDRCYKLFKEMKDDPLCSPSIVTLNILLSVFGRTMLIDQMEQIMQEIVDCNLSPNATTFNILIESFLTSWMWDRMETVYLIMQESPIEPNLQTYQLMLRGYAFSGNLEQMESTYEIIKDSVNASKVTLIRCMICAYQRSSAPDRVEKIEALLDLIPEEDYMPWMNVQMIRFYANENRLEKMERSISEAFQRKTIVVTVHVMRAITGAYFRLHALDKLIEFVRRAEYAGWKLCRSVYYCKMIMFGARGLLLEMEGVLNEMTNAGFDISRKALVTLFKGYLISRHTNKMKLVAGFMYKNGYEIPTDFGTHIS